MSARQAARPLLAALSAAIALAGCEAPPQAPFHEAKKLDASTGDISTQCGLAFQITAFPGEHQRELASLDAQASASARSLASVYGRNPNWIYQGETVSQIVVDAIEMLRSCGLTRAERALRAATSHHQS